MTMEQNQRQYLTGEQEYQEGDIKVTLYVDNGDVGGAGIFNLKVSAATLRRLERQMRWGGNLVFKYRGTVWLIPYHHVTAVSVERPQESGLTDRKVNRALNEGP